MYLRWVSTAAGEETVRKTLRGRFGPDKFDEAQFQLLSSYLYQLSHAPACGEYALNSLLTPIISHKSLPPPPPPEKLDSRWPHNSKVGVYAHEPLDQMFTERCDIPSMLVMYGDTDWLSYDGIEDTIARWRAGGKARGRVLDATYVTIPSAGHHIYLDNPDCFHIEMEKYCQRVFAKS